MRFSKPLLPATLVRRYKRFLFDGVLADGSTITGSCPNTGSMRGLTTPGSRIWLSQHDSPTRKYRHALELVEADGTLVGINTGLPNRIGEEAIREGLVGDLGGYPFISRERKYGRNSRIDLLLEDGLGRHAYVEIKNVHFMRSAGLAEFPDSATLRGAKHLDELAGMVAMGHRGIMLFVVQRNDCDHLRLCRDLDPVYCRAFDRAIAAGVEACALRCQVSADGIVPEKLIPVEEPGVCFRDDPCVAKELRR